MKNGLFRRYFSIYALTLVICTTLLGAVLLYFASEDFRQSKQLSLEASAQKAAVLVASNYELNNQQMISRPYLQEAFKLIYDTSGNIVLFSDVAGNIEICSDDSYCDIVSHVIPSEILGETFEQTGYSEVGYLGGFYDENAQYSYGIPIYYGTEFLGFVFTSTSVNSLFEYLFELLVLFFVSSVIMLASSSVIIYFATKMLTKPLEEMSIAAKSFSFGDFSARVTETGQDEIGRLAGVFNTMAVSLNELESARRSFIANVSHELRTPMTTIGGYIDGILDQTIPQEQQEHYLEVANQEVKRLARLTSSLLDISRLDEGREDMYIESVNVWDIIINVMISAELRIEAKKINVVDLDAKASYVFCDKDKLHQIVYNLIDNAIKFTPENGKLEIDVVQNNPETTSVTVTNSGNGIPSCEIPFIFERFYKADKSRALDKKGTGLGLYIAKTLVQRMGGSISVSSVEGEYTKFTVKLRADSNPASPIRQPQTESNAVSTETSNTSSWIAATTRKTKKGAD